MNICSLFLQKNIMPRPKRKRRIQSPPRIIGLKPIGIKMRDRKAVSMQYEEYEAIRLADYSNMSQEEASKEMKISRPTFTRIYSSARKKIALAIVECKALIIEGGNVEFDKQWYKCNNCDNIYEETEDENCPTCKSDSNIENINENIDKWRRNKFKNKIKEV